MLDDHLKESKCVSPCEQLYQETPSVSITVLENKTYGCLTDS